MLNKNIQDLKGKDNQKQQLLTINYSHIAIHATKNFDSYQAKGKN